MGLHYGSLGNVIYSYCINFSLTPLLSPLTHMENFSAPLNLVQCEDNIPYTDKVTQRVGHVSWGYLR